MSEWRPIETAPKDGTRILCGWPNGVGFGSFDWVPWSATYELGMGHDSDQYNTGFVTHWMPLPEPPK